MRVSTQDQRPDRQIDGLTPLCDELHVECLSAASQHRPVYESVIASLQANDCLIVWDLDRAWRSTLDALSELQKLRDRGVDFQIATMAVDHSSAAGTLILTIVAAVAQHERMNLSKRTKEGLAAARNRGVRLGRSPKLDEHKLTKAAQLIASGQEPAAVARRFKVAPWTLVRALRRSSMMPTAR
ncbi:MAG TPA: recombinase family protein [Phenylobacterium sp.]